MIFVADSVDFCYVSGMKNNRLILFIAAIAALACICGSYNASAQGAKAAKPAAQAQAAPAAQAPAAPSFETTKDFGKLDDTLQQAWTAAKSSGNMGTRVDCFVRISDVPDPGDRTFLEDHGMTVITFAGPVARGYMNVGALPSVASLPFVSTIKSAN
jgi:hypothetical protein